MYTKVVEAVYIACRKNSSCRQVQPTSLPWKIPSLLLGSLIACLHHLVYYCILNVYKGSGDRLHCMGGYEYNKWNTSEKVANQPLIRKTISHFGTFGNPEAIYPTTSIRTLNVLLAARSIPEIWHEHLRTKCCRYVLMIEFKNVVNMNRGRAMSSPVTSLRSFSTSWRGLDRSFGEISSQDYCM